MKMRCAAAACTAMLAAALAAGEGPATPNATPGAPASAPATSPAARVFELQEYRVFEGPDAVRVPIIQALDADLQPQPRKTVKKYPALQSSHPMYATLLVGNEPGNPDPWARFDMVLDASAKVAPKAAGTQKTPGAPATGNAPVHPMPDYDLLYIDLDQDGDLTNDAPIKLMADPPKRLLPQQEGERRVAFDYVTLKVGANKRAMRLLPCWSTYKSGEEELTWMSFASPVARMGVIELGTKRYQLVPGVPFSVSGRYDLPGTQLWLRQIDASGKPAAENAAEWLTLETLYRVDGTFYQLSLTPAGDKLTVDAYRGDMGSIALGAGKRKIGGKDLGMTGMLALEEMTVPLAGEGAREFQIPVGNYAVRILRVQYGPMRLSLSTFYAPEEPAASQPAARNEHPLKIRKDTPLVLDFDAVPEVRFLSPVTGVSFKPGDEVSIGVALVDPALNLKYRGIVDTKRMEKRTYTLADGKTQTVDEPATMIATVSIKDAAGVEVFTGEMPFG